MQSEWEKKTFPNHEKRNYGQRSKRINYTNTPNDLPTTVLFKGLSSTISKSMCEFFQMSYLQFRKKIYQNTKHRKKLK